MNPCINFCPKVSKNIPHSKSKISIIRPLSTTVQWGAIVKFHNCDHVIVLVLLNSDHQVAEEKAIEILSTESLETFEIEVWVEIK